MVKKLKNNLLLEKIPELFDKEKRGKVLDLGCGRGHFSDRIHQLGFDVLAADVAERYFKYKDFGIKWVHCDLSKHLNFPDNTFDYVLFLEVIEHLENPFAVVREISRVLKPGGSLYISTPNILNIGSRFRFLFEGCFDFFREPVLDYSKVYEELYPGNLQNMHLIPWRYHELEYMLDRCGLDVTKIESDRIYHHMKPLYYLLWPILKLQTSSKERRSLKKGGMDFRRIHKILFSDPILFGRHLIVRATKKGPHE